VFPVLLEQEHYLNILPLEQLFLL